MISLELSVRQGDCPLSAASRAHEVAFVTPHWHYHHDTGSLELRVLADGDDREAVERGLEVLRSHEGTESFELLAKQGSAARARLTMGTTHAMRAVIAHDGYLTGPFRNVDGSERWEIGFDGTAAADGALEDLADHDEFVVRERTRLDPATVLEDVRAEEIGAAMLEASRDLTPTERETVRRAIETGYYEVPRETTLGDLATAFDVSDAAVSKTLRRAETKLLSPTADVLARERDGPRCGE
ncbi:helix-turn-helix domain-containing protein [Natrialbaceae archaeon A-gly3]